MLKILLNYGGNPRFDAYTDVVDVREKGARRARRATRGSINPEEARVEGEAGETKSTIFVESSTSNKYLRSALQRAASASFKPSAGAREVQTRLAPPECHPGVA